MSKRMLSNVNRVIVTTLVITFLCQSRILAFGETINSDTTIEEGYVYPVVPGTENWEKLENHIEMIEVCLIPEELINTMSTEKLLKSVLSYPLMGDMFAWNTCN